MRFLGESIFDAMLFMLSGYALADGLAIESPGETTTATYATSPATPVRSNAEPHGLLQRFEMEYQAAHANPFYAQIKSFYNAQVALAPPIGIRMITPASVAPEQASSYFNVDGSAAPQLTLVQSSNMVLPGGGRPQRRLALMVSEWTFSGSAQVFSSNKSATLTVRRRF
ncbi:MAG TPA: hypothetical protein VLC92_09340 [Rhodocyclaceae bacterium]|nr:hypothetical protein [Rhodocyclaceae bacterium]